MTDYIFFLLNSLLYWHPDHQIVFMRNLVTQGKTGAITHSMYQNKVKNITENIICQLGFVPNQKNRTEIV